MKRIICLSIAVAFPAAWPAQTVHPQASPAPTSQFVTVDRDVKLEVLDWGGTGRPLILLAGLGATAHAYERFAPQLTPSYHVYAITRRGFGASSNPADGYTADRLGDDVLAVIDSLRLRGAVVAGHSIAGEELSSIGSRHPEKIAGLIYLDAAYSYAFSDPARGGSQEDWRLLPPVGARLPLPTAGPRPAPPPAMLAINSGMQQYTSIRAPTLAIYALPKDKPANLPNDSAWVAAWAAHERAAVAQADAFERGVPGSRVVRIPHADHAVFQSNPTDVIREINAFTAALPEGK